MIKILLTYLVASTLATGLVIVMGLRSRSTRALADAQQDWCDPAIAPAWDDRESHNNELDGLADVGAAIRLVLEDLAPIMAAQSIEAEIALPAELLVRMRPPVLRDLLQEMLSAAVRDAPASRLLITATTHGDLIRVAVSDNLPGADAASRRGAVRELMERVAMRGAALDIHVRPDEGTTTTLRLAAGTRTPLAAPKPRVGILAVQVER